MNMSYHVITFDQGEQLMIETTMSEEEFEGLLTEYKKYFDEIMDSDYDEDPMSIFEWAEEHTDEIVRELEVIWHDFNN